MNFYKLLESAKNGNVEALDTLIQMYMPLIRKFSYIDGEFDEDLHQEQILKFIYCVKKFTSDFSGK